MARWRKAVNLKGQRGSILVTVLGVLAVLLTVFLAAMTYSLSRFSYHKKRQSHLVAANLSEAGIARFLSCLQAEDQFGCGDTASTPNGGSFATKASAWGPYVLITSDGFYANQTARKTAIVGSALDSLCSAAISVGNENYPFTVAGHTRIIGDVYTGALGIASGRIKGEGVTLQDYHTGENIVSENIDIPSLDTVVLAQYFSEMQTRRINAGVVMEGSALLGVSDAARLPKGKAVYIENNLELNDFVAEATSEVTSLFVGGFVEIRNCTKITGLLEIVASGSIYVKDSAVLDNVILYAQDSIVFSGNARFSGVALAHRSISVRDRASLVYPSTVVLQANDADSESEGGISLTSNGRMESICFLSIANDNVNKQDYKLFLDPSAVFAGVLWSEGVADIGGYVYGTIVVEQFIYELPPTTYVNWVRDLYINRNALTYAPALPLLSDNDLPRQFRILRQDWHN